MADWFVGPVMDKIVNACFDYLQDQYRSQTGMKEELQRLRANHPKIQAVVSAYTRAEITVPNPALNSWIWQLRNAIDEANDVLDDFDYMKHKEQLELNMEKTKVRSSFARLFSEPARKFRRVCERVLKKDPNLERLEVVVKKLDNVSAEVSTFLHILQYAKQEQQEQQEKLRKDRETGCLPNNQLIGRGEEMDFVMQWLRKPTNEDPTHIASPSLYKNISLLSIVGHGGMGKTTLIQHIYEDLKDEFELKIWVCVSNDFNAKKIIADMLEFVKEDRPRLESPLAAVQQRLKAVVQSKRFLLVLDDIWEEDMNKWECVLCPLLYGGLGSKILLTTRMNSVASEIAKVIKKKVEPLRLKGLEEDVCLKLLNTHAFAGVENLGSHKKLTDIASSIVKKLSGCPLAVKIIGGVLNSNLNERFWTNILNNSVVLNIELEPGHNNILPILRLSFTFLPQPLQNCFAFCGIFPQDYEFDKDDVVRMWIALGFIHESSIEGETLEDIGGRYFDVLVRKSFFHEFPYLGRKIYYKIHDLLHDLAKSISQEECFGFVGEDALSLNIPKNIRHLFVKTESMEVLRMIKDVRNLHSLFLTCENVCQGSTEIFTEILKASSSIRLLFIRSIRQTLMPEAIEKLKHLRYLNLGVTLTQIPRSASNLYHLQFIINEDWHRQHWSDFLPGDLSNLSNLRHLKLPENVSVPGIGKLRSLQELNEFNVKNENGYRIGELEHMHELHQLKIHFLENVKDASEARTAKLFEKRKLTDLLLNWGKTFNKFRIDRAFGSQRKIVNSDLDVNVLENLEPYKKLKRLSIVLYEGGSSAKWMYNADLMSNLEYIGLDGCSKWETLPPFGKLSHLKSLYLRSMPKTKQLDYKFHENDEVSVFPSLEVLNMEGLQVLENWFDGEAAAAYDRFFPTLKKMKIQKIGWKAALNCKQGSNNCCGNTKSIPLEILEVLSCPNITSLLQADVRLEALKKLSIEDCPNLISLGGVFIDDPSLLPSVSSTSFEKLTIEAEQWFPHVCSSLRELTLIGLVSLQSLPSSLERLPSLKILRVQNVPQLRQLLHIPASLENLHLVDLKSLHCLPSSLSANSSLKSLYLDSIPLLKSLPDLPSSLNSLSLVSLDKLEYLPSSLSAISSLNHLKLESIPLLESLPDLPSFLNYLSLKSLDKLECLPSSLSAISSLKFLVLENIPLFKSDLPSFLKYRSLKSLDKLECLPSSLSAISSLERLYVSSIPLLKLLPNLPSSLIALSLNNLDKLECLPSSLSANSSLERLDLYRIPLLKSLPDLPSSLESLSLFKLDNLECLPSSLSAIPSLNRLYLESVPLLKSLPDLPSSLHELRLENCNPELMKRYNKISGSDWHKIAHIRLVRIGY